MLENSFKFVFINNWRSIDKKILFCFFLLFFLGLFFSFSSRSSLAKDCIYLLNFFPKNEVSQLLSYLNEDAKVALLYPENEYGYLINSFIDDSLDYDSNYFFENPMEIQISCSKDLVYYLLHTLDLLHIFFLNILDNQMHIHFLPYKLKYSQNL